MPIIDPGVTTFDDLGRPTLSSQATRLPNPPNMQAIAPNVSQMPAGPGNSVSSAPAPQANLPNLRSGAGSIPIASDRYADVESKAPQRNDPQFQQHGLAKFGNILTSLTTGPFAPLIYNALKQVPYQRAERDWQNRLAAIKPEIETENAMRRETGENTRASASLASSDASRKATESHQRAIEDESKERQNEIERRNKEVEVENDKRIKQQQRRDDINQQIRDNAEKQRIQHETNQEGFEKRRLDIEAARLNKEAGDKGTWTVETDDAGKKYLFNNKTREIQDAPSRGINKPSDVAKADAKQAPVKAAVDFANSYVKDGKFTGAEDEALLEKYFELAKPSSGFRMTQPQMQMLQRARSWTQGIGAQLKHATTGTYFDDDQRKEIVGAINDLAKATGIKSEGSSTNQNQNPVKINHRRDAN